MKSFRPSWSGLASLLAVGALMVVPHFASAQLTGTQVTGSLIFGGSGPNFFDPASGFVPNGYLNKTEGTTVTIAEPGIEFGFADAANTDIANFTANQLTVTDVVGSLGAAPWTMTFTDPSFSSIEKISDSFTHGGITSSLAGDTITLSWAGLSNDNINTAATFTAVFNVGSGTSAVPEPGTIALFATSSLTGAAFLLRRRARKNAGR